MSRLGGRAGDKAMGDKAAGAVNGAAAMAWRAAAIRRERQVRGEGEAGEVRIRAGAEGADGGLGTPHSASTRTQAGCPD